VPDHRCWVVAPLLVVAGLVGATAIPAGADEDRPLSTNGAIVRAPGRPATATLTPVQGCQVLLETGQGDCAVVRAAGGDLVFTVEALAPADETLVERPWRVRVYRQADGAPDQWDVALENPDPQQRTFANVRAQVADVSGDGYEDLVVGYRAAGTGGFLDVDVITGSASGPKVAGHTRLAKGTADVRRDRIVDYSAVYRRTDGTCCPTWIQRRVVQGHDGGLRVVDRERIPTKRADVPPGNLG
jgi:hypothetical protein